MLLVYPIVYPTYLSDQLFKTWLYCYFLMAKYWWILVAYRMRLKFLSNFWWFQSLFQYSVILFFEPHFLILPLQNLIFWFNRTKTTGSFFTVWWHVLEFIPLMIAFFYSSACQNLPHLWELLKYHILHEGRYQHKTYLSRTVVNLL